jgi:hypothetical protein
VPSDSAMVAAFRGTPWTIPDPVPA